LVLVVLLFHFGPIGDRVFKPAQDLINWFDQTFDSSAENDELNAEVQALRRQIVAGKTAQAENAELRRLIRFNRSGVLPQDLEVVTGRVIVRSLQDPYSSLGINRGATDCVKPGDAVFNGHGLVGQVDRVDQNTAKVRLVTNPMSAVSAMVESTDVRGLVKPEAGESSRLILSFINQSRPLYAGQEILTSGWRGPQISSGFPANIPIGRITASSPSRQAATGSVPVKLYVDLNNLSLVQILTRCTID